MLGSSNEDLFPLWNSQDTLSLRLLDTKRGASVCADCWAQSLNPHFSVRNMVTGKSCVRELSVHLPPFTVLLWPFLFIRRAANKKCVCMLSQGAFWEHPG